MRRFLLAFSACTKPPQAPKTPGDVGAIRPDESQAIYNANYCNPGCGAELPASDGLVLIDVSVDGRWRRGVSTPRA